MSDSPDFSFFLDGAATPVRPGDNLWRRPLPLSRRAGAAASADAPGPCTGDYFCAVESFLTADAYRHLLSAFADSEFTTRRLPASVQIHLVKHGAFYHPAKVIVHAGERRFTRVVNVAVSDQGKAVIAEEVAALHRLHETDPGVIPAVYGASESIGPYEMAVFIADWLEGFFEWHLTGGDAGRVCRRSVLWDPVRGHRELSAGETTALFRRIAAILTGFYDVTTSCHIARWHHGAGDFIMRSEGCAQVDVRLITVRRYAPLMAGLEGRPEDMIDALVAFFIELTLKNRLDRRDGVGDMVLFETAAVEWTMAGFIDGLYNQVHAGRLPVDFPQEFFAYLNAMGKKGVSSLLASLIDRLPAGTEVHTLLSRYGDTHLAALMAAIAAANDRLQQPHLTREAVS